MAMRPVSPEGASWHEAVERSGMFLILIGILGRTWCSMYIGGHKLARLVTDGPYSVTRNPLYVFSVDRRLWRRRPVRQHRVRADLRCRDCLAIFGW